MRRAPSRPIVVHAPSARGAVAVDDPSASSSYPPDWAFVMQLRSGTPFQPALLNGRIEHVQTGHACLFGSLEEARAFMERVMTPATGAAP